MYIIDKEKQIGLIREMKQLRKDSTKYEVYYHHPYTNQMWKSFFPLSDGGMLGPKLMRKEPLSTDIEECLNICLVESAPENAIGLGIEWSVHTTLWPDIIKALEQNYSHYQRSQLKLFLNHLNIEEVDAPSAEKEKEKEKKPARKKLPVFTGEELHNLIWRSRKIRMKRFFVLG